MAEYLKGISPERINLMDKIIIDNLNKPRISEDLSLIIKSILTDAHGNAFTELETAVLFLKAGITAYEITQIELKKIINTIHINN